MRVRKSTEGSKIGDNESSLPFETFVMRRRP